MVYLSEKAMKRLNISIASTYLFIKKEVEESSMKIG